ncbi:MAG: hypothetical protein KGN77_01775 [Xanthomonadaceae bacterium]|nr:hypothetical protein [Xanthomonadaceae bacterium]
MSGLVAEIGGFASTTPSVLAGVPQATLQTWLGQAQQAYADFMTGGKPVTVSYANGSGTRSVTYNKANVQQLTQFISELNQALGNTRGRRAIGVRF